MLGFNVIWTENFQMYKPDLEMAEKPEIKFPTSNGSQEKQENTPPPKIYFCFIKYYKAFDCVDHKKQWKILHEIEIVDHLTWLLRNLYAG